MSDLISRQDAIDAVENNSYGMGSRASVKAIKSLPSAEARPTGKWVDTTSNQHYKCSVCGYRAGYWFNEENSCEYSMDMSEWLSNFCPNCGARMKGADDE